jgi:DNA-binding beta-propeller fold protein YncE
LWVANSADGTVSQVDTTRAATVRTIRVAGGDVALVADGDTIWVANSSNNSVSKISP